MTDGRPSHHAFLLAIGALLLCVGILIGHFALHHERTVLAGNHEIPTELATAFVKIAKRVEPSVVNISTVTQPQSSRDRNTTIENQLPFDLTRPDREVRRGNGSGVIVDASGFILTNHHVVVGADRIKVKLASGDEYVGRVVGSDRETDLAVVKIEPRTQLQSARLGDSDKSEVGDWVLAIGSPFGLDQTVTAGIISAKDREANELRDRASFQHFLQTDAAINRGNSGGPLINLAGEVIGINTAIATTTGDYNGVGFALPSEEAVHIYRQLNKDGRVTRGFLGVFTDPVTTQIAKVYGLPAARGAIVSVIRDTYRVDGREVPTPAAKAGFKLGDVLLQYRGDGIRNSLDLIRRVANTPVGTDVEIKFIRNGQELTIPVRIGIRPAFSEPVRETSASSISSENTRTLGLDVANLPTSAAKDLEADGVSGVIVTKVEPGSVADDAELRRDDIIEKINRQALPSATQFRRSLERIAPGDAIVLQVFRRRSSEPRRFVSLNKP